MADNPFQRAEDEYFRLKGQLAAGRITPEQFDAAIKNLMVQDVQGRYWMLGPDTGKWYVHDGTTWVEAQPPVSAPSAPMAPSPVTAQPAAAQPRGWSRSQIIAVGAVLLVGLVAVVAVVLAVNAGLLSPRTAPAIVPTAIAVASPVPPRAPSVPPATAMPTLVVVPTKIPTSVAEPQKQPVEISVYCGYYKQSPRYAEVGQPIVLSWAWLAATDAYRQDYINAASFLIKIDGQEIDISAVSKTLTSESQGSKVTWRLPPRTLPAGTHQVVPTATLSRQVTDGFDSDKDGKLDVFGPGADTLPPCEIIVK